MRGLCKNHLLAVWGSARILLLFLLGMGAVVSVLPAPTLQMYFVMIGIVGFSVIAATAAGGELSSKWSKYRLTLPVRRSEIVASLFLNQLLWLGIGVGVVGSVTAFSRLLHGGLPGQLAELFALGVSISLFLGAIFLPLLQLAGEEKVIVLLVISLLCAVGLAAMLFNLSEVMPLLGTLVMLCCAVLLFALSYPLTVYLFRHREY